MNRGIKVLFHYPWWFLPFTAETDKKFKFLNCVIKFHMWITNLQETRFNWLKGSLQIRKYSSNITLLLFSFRCLQRDYQMSAYIMNLTSKLKQLKATSKLKLKNCFVYFVSELRVIYVLPYIFMVLVNGKMVNVVNGLSN